MVRQVVREPHLKIRFNRHICDSCDCDLLATLATLATLLGLTLAPIEQDVPEFTLLRTVTRFNKAILSFCARVLLCRNNAPVLIHYKIGPNELAVGFVRGPHPHLLSGSDQVFVRFTVHVIQSVGTPIYALHFYCFVWLL